MKAFVSIVLVLAFIVPLFLSSTLYKSTEHQSQLAEQKIILIESRNAADINIKRAVKQVFASAKGETRYERVLDVANKMKKLERFEENENVDVWFGNLENREEKQMINKMLKEKKPIKCNGCFDFDTMGVDWHGNPVPLSMAFLDSPLPGKTIISKTGLSFVPDFPIAAENIYFGASIYKNGIATVILMPEGFENG